MKTEILFVGQKFKNYKEMCLELEIEIKGNTNSKKAQYKELSRYCNFVKDGHKIIIKEVYETPKDKIDGRGKSEGSRRSIYSNAVQLLITDLLARSNGHVSISKNKLMQSIGMVNINYGECGKQVKKLAQYIHIDEKVINDFYNINNSNLKGILETALDNLEDKSIIIYSKIIKVSEQGKQNKFPRKATLWEATKIMECEKETLEEFGFDEKSKIRVSKKWMDFQKEVLYKLQKCTEIQYYYQAYEITVNQKYIEHERNKLAELLLEQVTREETKVNLNTTIIEHFINNSKERKENQFTSSKKAAIRSNNTYIDDMKLLASLLIDLNAKNITSAVRNTEVEILPKEVLDQFEFEMMFG